MNHPSQTSIAKEEIQRQIKDGKTDMKEIYTIVCSKLFIPRPTVRRAKQVLLEDLKEQVKILENMEKKKN